MSNQSIFDQKTSLKNEHERLLKEETARRKQLTDSTEAKKKTIQQLQRDIQKQTQKGQRLQKQMLLIQSTRSMVKKDLQRVDEQGNQQLQKFNELTREANQSASSKKELIKEIQTLRAKYPVNRSYEATSDAVKQLERLLFLELKLKDFNQSPKDRQKITQSASSVQSSNKAKKGLLIQIKKLVEEEQEKEKQIKHVNQSIKASQQKINALKDLIQKSATKLLQLDAQTKKAVAARDQQLSFLPSPPADETLFISNEGMKALIQNFDPKCPQKGYYWTDDYKKELPIFLSKQGPGSIPPMTLIGLWRQALKKFGDRPALTYEVAEGQWKSITFKQYYEEGRRFGKACISHGLSQYSAVMIIGFNSPEWMIAFFGSIFARYLPVGLYTSNGIETCEYIANHCEGELAVLEDVTQLKKYYSIIDNCPKLKYFVLYKDEVPKDLPKQLQGRVFTWSQFIQKGSNESDSQLDQVLQERMQKQQPGNCVTLVYTSGTTGMPKAVMLNHDSYPYMCIAAQLRFRGNKMNGNGRILTYLPLSHVAGQFLDIIFPVCYGQNVFFPDPTVLQGSMLKYLLIARPTIFLGVPRVWEKLEQKLAVTLSTTTGLKKKLMDWAMGLGIEGTFAQVHGNPTPRGWFLAKKLFNKIKAGMGLEECEVFVTGAAPMRATTRKFFLQINFSLLNVYGMSETTGAHSCTDSTLWPELSDDYLKEAGIPSAGLETCIEGQDKDGKGEVCMRGRSRFMGYYKNQIQNSKTIDKKGFVHSGDEGRIDQRGVLYITGRLKELIVTAGGENVPPVLIENEIVKHLSIVSQVVVIGDMRKYLACLVCLKFKSPTQLADEVIEAIKKEGSSAQTAAEAANCPKVNALIKRGIEEANKKAISNAQRVQKHTILPLELTVESGVLTPTMKLKRRVVNEMFKKEIESMYIDSKL